LVSEHVIVAGISRAGQTSSTIHLDAQLAAGLYERYNTLGYLHLDPVIRKLADKTTMPVVWSEAPNESSSDKTATPS